MRRARQGKRQARQRRRGAVAVLMAILLIPLFIFMVLCIDVGWITKSKSELQNAADSAAAAGASQLIDDYTLYNLAAVADRSAFINTAKQQATTACVQYGSYNRVGEVHSLSVVSSDIQFGFTNSNGSVQSAYGVYPNTLQVVTRRDHTVNGPLPLFFASVLGSNSKTISANASGTIYTGVITSFDPNGGGESANASYSQWAGNFNGNSSTGSSGSGSGGSGSGSGNGNGNGNGNGGTSGSGSGGSSSGNVSSGGSGGSSGSSGSLASINGGSGSSVTAPNLKCLLLPVAFDVNYWNQYFANGKSPDGNVYTTTVNNITIPQIQIYPSPQQCPGNFGLLDIGPWTNATPDYENWILNGPSSSDLKYLLSQGMLPVCAQTPKAWKGSPGLRNVLSGDFATIIGKPRLLPLFQPASTSPYQAASGAGSNATYNIVGFAGVTVTQVTGNGSNLSICVRPCGVLDPTAVFDPTTVYPAGTQPSTQLQSFTHVGAKLTH